MSLFLILDTLSVETRDLLSQSRYFFLLIIFRSGSFNEARRYELGHGHPQVTDDFALDIFGFFDRLHYGVDAVTITPAIEVEG